MYNYQFNRHNVGINKLAQIHFTIWCFPSCQNDTIPLSRTRGWSCLCRRRFCCFLLGLADIFPCGSIIDTFPGSSAGGSGFCPMIVSTFAHTSASTKFIDANFCKQIVNTRLKALDEIYKIYTYASFTHFCTSPIFRKSAKFHQTFSHLCTFIFKISSILQFSSKIRLYR